jgi:quinol monooxygenase YgiN
MLNVLFFVTTKPGQEEAMRQLTLEMMRVSREEDGAVSYTFHRQKKQPREWMLYEQWRDRAHLEAHHVNMKKHFGEPPEGAQLPARLHALIETWRATWYDLVE